MEKLRSWLASLPKVIFTLPTVVLILWLTLAPKPLGDNPPQLFPGADKLVHGIMFGFLEFVMLLDWQRIHKWQKTSWGQVTLYATAVSIFGAFIECIQKMMGLGRGFDWMDIVADTLGAFTVACFWMFFQKIWLPIHND